MSEKVAEKTAFRRRRRASYCDSEFQVEDRRSAYVRPDHLLRHATPILKFAANIMFYIVNRKLI